jgi:hypothetical protein
MTDPRDFDRRWDLERGMNSPTPWGWIAGAVFIIVILVLVFTSGEGTRTAGTDVGPPATTGMAPRTAPPAIPVRPRLGESPANSGQNAQ